MSDANAAPPNLLGGSGGPPGLPAGPRPTRVRRLVFTLACGISFLLYLHRYTWGFIKPDLQEEFGWGPVALGWLDSLFAMTYGGAQVPSGVLCDWFGAHLLLGMCVVFQIPTLAFFLGKMRLVTARFLWRNFKYAILVIFIAAAVITPSGDMITQSIFAAPMIGLYLLGILIAWIVGPIA